MELSSTERNWAMACHLGTFSSIIIPFGNFIVPLVIWLSKKEESSFIDQHGRASLNFQLSVFIYSILLAILTVIGVFSTLMMQGSWDWHEHFDHLEFTHFIWLIPVVGFFIILTVIYLIFIIMASIRASEGKPYTYPLTIRFF